MQKRKKNNPPQKPNCQDNIFNTYTRQTVGFQIGKQSVMTVL